MANMRTAACCTNKTASTFASGHLSVCSLADPLYGSTSLPLHQPPHGQAAACSPYTHAQACSCTYISCMPHVPYINPFKNLTPGPQPIICQPTSVKLSAVQVFIWPGNSSDRNTATKGVAKSFMPCT